MPGTLHWLELNLTGPRHLLNTAASRGTEDNRPVAGWQHVAALPRAPPLCFEPDCYLPRAGQHARRFVVTPY